MTRQRRFFSGDTLTQAVNQAGQHFQVPADQIDYKLIEKRHGFLKVRRKVVIEVDEAQPCRSPEGATARTESSSGAERAGASDTWSEVVRVPAAGDSPRADAVTPTPPADEAEERSEPVEARATSWFDHEPEADLESESESRSRSEPEPEPATGGEEGDDLEAAREPEMEPARPADREPRFDSSATGRDADDDRHRGGDNQQHRGADDRHRSTADDDRHPSPATEGGAGADASDERAASGESATEEKVAADDEGAARSKRGRRSRRGRGGRGRRDGSQRVELAAAPLAAKARYSAAQGEEAEAAAEALDRILKLAGLVVESEILQGDECLQIELRGADQDLLLRDRGRLLLAIQHLLPRAVRGLIGRSVVCRVDSDNYHEIREERLRDMAQRAADEVRDRGRPKTLEPMSPDERRIVHLTLADYPGVETESHGSGLFKRVMVRSAGGGRAQRSEGYRR